MAERTLEVDYVIVGAGAVALAFADTMLDDSDATMAIVDRRALPGGHWNDAYGFVRLHSQSATYGVNSRPLGDDALIAEGLSRGFQHLATGAEVRSYFQGLMQLRMLPSGRVHYLSEHEYRDGAAYALTDGAPTRLIVRKKLVDATMADTRIPATHQRAFAVAEGVRCVAPNALPDMDLRRQRFVVIGAGKTAIDTAIWLQGQGVAPAAITWVRPREPWLLNRGHLQSDFSFFGETFGALATEFEAARDAASLDDLFARLEAADVLRRIDQTETPTMYRCAIVSDPELEMARRVHDVVRLGRVLAIEPNRIVFAQGERATEPGAIFVDCTGDGLPKRPLEPMFQPGRIALQYVRRCTPTLSAAFVAHIEATRTHDEERNALCTPVPLPREPLDWLRMHLADARNRSAWGKQDDLQLWLSRSRLDGYSAMTVRAMLEPTEESTALMQRYRTAVRPGLARMVELLREAEAGA
jgi:hypothetical protein